MCHLYLCDSPCHLFFCSFSSWIWAHGTYQDNIMIQQVNGDERVTIWNVGYYYFFFLMRQEDTTILHTCANIICQSHCWSPPLEVCVSRQASCVIFTLRATEEVTVVTISQRTVWRRGPLIIRDRETDSESDRRTDRQTVPQRAQTGPDKYKARTKSTYGQEK